MTDDSGQPTSDRPDSTSVLLGICPRDEDTQLRFSVGTCAGHPFFRMQIWRRQRNTWRPDKTKDVTVRRHELPVLKSALGAASNYFLTDNRNGKA